jgi:hypothetical protein
MTSLRFGFILHIGGFLFVTEGNLDQRTQGFQKGPPQGRGQGVKETVHDAEECLLEIFYRRPARGSYGQFGLAPLLLQSYESVLFPELLA